MTSGHDEHSRLAICFSHDTELVPRLHAYVASIHQIDALRGEANSSRSRLNNLPAFIVERICNALLEINYHSSSRQWDEMEKCRLSLQRRGGNNYSCCRQYNSYIKNEEDLAALRQKSVQDTIRFWEVEKLIIFDRECEFRHFANVKQQSDELIELARCPDVSFPIRYITTKSWLPSISANKSKRPQS